MANKAEDHEYRPVKAIMTACETITWIAFRRAIPKEKIGLLFKVTPNRWLHVPAETVLEALEARAGMKGGGPYCAINWANGSMFDPDDFPSRHRAFSRCGPHMLRLISTLHNRSTGNVISYATLAIMLRKEMADDERVYEQIMEARTQLRDQADAGLVTAYGIPWVPEGSRRAGGAVEVIPATVFMHPAISITEWDELHEDTSGPIGEWLHRKLSRFEHIQFKRVEVLSIWRPGAAGGASHSNEGTHSASKRSVWDDVLKRWMHGYATQVVKTGQKPKREPTIRLCREKHQTTHKKAEAAWNTFPPEYKNWPRTGRE